jgi:peptidoglycan hydrolase-like protein with peptidoglycan-binding domain
MSGKIGRKIIIVGFLFLMAPSLAGAQELLSEKEFYVDPSFDLNGREKITAVLQTITDQIYFYFEKGWWENMSIEKRKEINIAIADISQEFQKNIYPTLISNFGSEWRPGIDGENRIVVLVHQMAGEAAGYFSPGDEYLLAQVKNSNQKEMVYLSPTSIFSPARKSFFAHEFTHLITFNQKDRLKGVSEETWLNEGRAEYAPTLLGYDKQYEGSNLQARVRNFLANPQDSLTEWQGKPSDYGVLNLFIQYLVDHYGKEILIDSLHSDKIGIPSLEEALKKNGFKESFSQVFIDWTIAIFLNNCASSPKYCYLNDNLANFKVTPFVYFLPTLGESTLSVGSLSKEWAGNWQKIIGDQDSLKLDFNGISKSNFKIPYIVEKTSGSLSVGFLHLDQSQKGTTYFQDGKIKSLTIIPSVQNKNSGFSENEPSYQFFWSVSNEKPAAEQESELIKELEDRIASLKATIAVLQAQIAGASGKNASCSLIQNNLYYGMKNNLEVMCLQQFLKKQGVEIYPEGLVTGNFGNMTYSAVVRFQEKYANEILTPLGKEKGTGFVGLATRIKINKML